MNAEVEILPQWMASTSKHWRK